MMPPKKSLKHIFDDVDFAWELLETEIKFDISDQVCPEDVSYLLQLYMRGVQKMNSLMDLRESFFKNKVTALMSRPAVIKILNKPMGKKNQAPLVEAVPQKKIDSLKQLQLKERRKQIEMRLAYGAEQHRPEKLNKMLAEQSQKQSFLTSKINKIVDSHEERLMNRVRERKLRTLTAKSRSQAFLGYEQNGLNSNSIKDKVNMMQIRRDEEQFGGIFITKQEKKQFRKNRSVELMRVKEVDQQALSPTRRRVSMDFSALEKEKSSPNSLKKLFKN